MTLEFVFLNTYHIVTIFTSSLAGCVQPGSTGRDDIRRQEAVSVTDDAKWKSSGTTRASPALAHGADEGYSVVKEQSDIIVTAGNENDNLAAAASPNKTAAVADDRPSAKNSHPSVRSLKHKSDRSYKYGTGSADLHRASSLQDLPDSGGSAVERSRHPLTDNAVSCGQIESDTASNVNRLHGTLSLPSDACSTDPACTRYDRPLTTCAGERLSSSRRSRCRVRQPATNQELESVGNTAIVSNTTQFWEDLVHDSSSSAAQIGIRSRNMSEVRHRYMRRDTASPRYSTIGATCDIQALHGMTCTSRTVPDVHSRSESLHVDSDLEVCVYSALYSFIFVACRCACLVRIRQAAHCMFLTCVLHAVILSLLLCILCCPLTACYFKYVFLHLSSYYVVLVVLSRQSSYFVAYFQLALCAFFGPQIF